MFQFLKIITNSLIINKFKNLFIINWSRFNKNNYFFSFLDSHLIHYPTPTNLTYAWSFGSLAGICLIIQIITGVFLATHYTPNMELAFNSVQYIMRDVPNGWFFRYVHANGASMFFIVVYIHLFRGLYYGSYIQPREFIWCSGVLILLLMMGTAFTGYVLPWGQMSFWGATVITSMVTVLPKGQAIAEWLWGGFVIKDPTLRRFFVIHYLLPFLIVGFSIVHLALLHKEGSNNPIGFDFNGDILPFYPYFVIKDVFAFACFLLFFGYFVFYNPEYLNHPDNYVKANPMKTPLHVVPEWYFLVFYAAILRGIPHKTGGILAMFGSIIILLTIPFTNTSIIRSTNYRPMFKLFFWLFVADCIILLWVGACDIKYKRYVLISQIGTIYYYLFFILFLPISGKIELFLLKQNNLKNNFLC
jgi:quinol-cytochrome oxidoreductase complex cytochrome b subunit